MIVLKSKVLIIVYSNSSGLQCCVMCIVQIINTQLYIKLGNTKCCACKNAKCRISPAISCKYQRPLQRRNHLFLLYNNFQIFFSSLNSKNSIYQQILQTMIKIKKITTVALTLLFATMIFSCTSEKTIQLNLAGEWICNEINNRNLFTNDIFVINFDGKDLQTYASGNKLNETNSFWAETHYIYQVKNNTIIIEGKDINDKDVEITLKVRSIDDDELVYKVSRKVVDGKLIDDDNLYSLDKVDDFYELAIIGKWEGRNVTPGTTDTEYHQWEYKPDGTYNYYYKNAEGEWETKNDNNGKYFLYGDIFASNWTNDYNTNVQGILYECWEIEFEGDTMNWKGRRGINQYVYYSMTKVRE